jgi:hypothetical protein
MNFVGAKTPKDGNMLELATFSADTLGNLFEKNPKTTRT